MADLTAALAANRAAAAEFLAVADKVGAAWSVAPAPGKWSPAQVTEHVAVGHEVTAKAVIGADSGLPKLPRFLHPLIRWLAFRRVLQQGRFPQMRTTKAFHPLRAPATPAEGRARLEQAVAKFEADVLGWSKGQDRTLAHPAFGAIALTDYVRYLEIHTRHHQKQIPGG